MALLSFNFVEVSFMAEQVAENKRAQAQRSPEELVLMGYLSQIGSISDAEFDQIFKLIKVRSYAKGKYLVREGGPGDTCYFVLRGCVRQFYIVDGIEKTTAFYTEGMPVSATFVYDNQPSKFFLICNEDTMLIEGKAEDEKKFFAQMPRMEMLSRVGVEKELQKSHEKMADFIISSPEARYLNLLETRPDLLERVPQYQLASFLGVTPESLSRIRKRIMVNGR